MSHAIEIEVDGKIYPAEIDDTVCGQAILDSLPINQHGNTWGEEIYFDIGVSASLDDTATDVVQLGDIGFWPPGSAICFFYGQTPMSTPDAIRPASEVNIVGRFLGDTEPLKQTKSGAEVVIRLKK
jgi:uncharacterized protein